MFEITTRLCGLQCLKVQLMVPSPMPVSSSKVQGKVENQEGRAKGIEIWKKDWAQRHKRHSGQGKISVNK